MNTNVYKQGDVSNKIYSVHKGEFWLYSYCNTKSNRLKDKTQTLYNLNETNAKGLNEEAKKIKITIIPKNEIVGEYET